MKISTINIKNTYSCQNPNCGKVFDLSEEVEIVPNIYPTCCESCELKAMYRQWFFTGEKDE
jgi:hypothetical protein